MEIDIKALITADPDCFMKQIRKVRAFSVLSDDELMKIASPLAVPELIEQTSPETLRIVAHPEPVKGEKSMDELLNSPPATGIVLTIGPEGGWTDEEIGQFAAAQWQVVGLGPRVLRMETAAIALVARCVIRDQWMS